MRPSRKQVSELREQLNRAIEAGELARADELCAALERAEPTEPRWPHRRGDILRRLGRDLPAAQAFTRAVDRYAARGFVARATAMAKVVLEIDPTQRDILRRVNPEPARELHRRLGPAVRARHPGLATEAGVRAPRAPSLEPARRAPRGETRFNDVPTGEIPLSTLELDSTPPSGDAFDEDAPTAQQLAQLPAVPLFAELPSATSGQLMRAATRHDIPPDQVVQQRGEPADALYVIVEGRVAVQGLEAESEHATALGEGSVFGEACLLNGARAVTARTLTRCVLLRIPRDALYDAARDHAQVGQVLFELLARRLVSSLFQTSRLFRGVPPEGKREIAKLFELRRVPEALRLVEVGKRSDGLYILLAGRCTAQTLDDPTPRELEPGAVFGQHSLLSGAVMNRTVHADPDALVLRLPARHYTRLISKYPPMLVPLAELAAAPLPRASS